MTETYTVEPADDTAPINPRYLRELRDLLRADDHLDLGLKLLDRPPARGQQGSVAVALQIATVATPLGPAFAYVLTRWIGRHEVAIKLCLKKGSLELNAGNVEDAARLIRELRSGTDAGPDDGD